MCKYFSQDDDPAGRMLGEVTSMLFTDIVEATWIQLKGNLQLIWNLSVDKQEIIKFYLKATGRGDIVDRQKIPVPSQHFTTSTNGSDLLTTRQSEGSKKEVVVIRVSNAKLNI